MRERFRGTYPANWPEIAEQIKAAAGWRCERCGHLDDPERCRELGVRRGRLPCDEGCRHAPDGKQRILTVHHLDGDKGNVERWNLVALCQVCHLEIQAKVEFYRPWMLPHSPWMARHVAAYNEWARRHGRPELPLVGVVEWKH